MKRLLLLVAVVLVLAACAAPAPAVSSTPTITPAPTHLTLVTHDSFDISAETLAAFKEQTGIEVQILKSGDAGEMLNTAILSKENPLGDVIFGVDNTFLSRALAADLFVPYNSPALADIPDRLELDPEHRLLPVDFGYVTINFDRKWFEQQGLKPPASLEDLAAPAYKGLTVVQNPASSSPGLAFLLTTIGHFGENGGYTYLNYWRDLRKNDVVVTDGWSEAYSGRFTVGSGGQGDRPIVVSYATSPAAEEFFNNLPEPPSASLNAPDTTFEQIEFVGIVAKSPNRAAAQAFVDFMLGPVFQADIPLHMFVYPTSDKADIGELFRQWAALPQEPVTFGPDEIAAHRDSWIEAWTDVMLR